MTADGRKLWIGRREAIALFGLLAGMASAALLTHAEPPSVQVVRLTT